MTLSHSASLSTVADTLYDLRSPPYFSENKLKFFYENKKFIPIPYHIIEYNEQEHQIS